MFACQLRVLTFLLCGISTLSSFITEIPYSKIDTTLLTPILQDHSIFSIVHVPTLHETRHDALFEAVRCADSTKNGWINANGAMRKTFAVKSKTSDLHIHGCDRFNKFSSKIRKLTDHVIDAVTNKISKELSNYTNIAWKTHDGNEFESFYEVVNNVEHFGTF